MPLSEKQVEQLVDAQQALDAAHHSAMAFTIACVPGNVRADQLNTWREQTVQEMTANARADLNSLLRDVGVEPADWAAAWEEAKNSRATA